MKFLEKKIIGFCVIYLAFLVGGTGGINAQSTRVEAPTPLTSNEITGKISARDIGDARLTTYYYAFNGNQGDIFLKIESLNFNGDIDVFYADSMRPLTKISLFADSTPTRTGREIYLRKPEKLILRVAGRTPNDDPATFLIKFEGSFVAMAGDSISEDDAPKVKNEVQGTVRVNSVGTIIEPISKPETKKSEVAQTAEDEPKAVEETEKEEKANSVENEELGRSRVAANKTVPKRTTATRPSNRRNSPPAGNRTTASRRTARPPRSTATPKRTAPAESETETEAQKLAKALENVSLVVLFKDGGKLEKPMNEILRFSVDKGILTIIAKNGSIGRHSMIDVAKVSIE